MRILFICTGNICRSPMAEGIFRHLTEDMNDVEIFSAGMGAVDGQPPSRNAVTAMSELGIDISHQRSNQLTKEMVETADFILVMTYGHLDMLLMIYPHASEKAFLIREFESGLPARQREVSDPIGGTETLYIQTRDQIYNALQHFLNVIQNSEIMVAEKASVKGPKILIGSTVNAFETKSSICHLLDEQNHHLVDIGAHSSQADEAIDEIFENFIHQRLLHHINTGILIFHSDTELKALRELFAKNPRIKAQFITHFSDDQLSKLQPGHPILCLAANRIDPQDALKLIKHWLQQEAPPTQNPTESETMNYDKLTSTNEIESTAPSLSQVDPEIFEIVEAEKKRQFHNIELIASENFTSRAVMETQGSCLTNKYAEGYPAKRWYGGCEEVDKAENLAIERARTLFGAEHVNVQPHSGSQANMAVYFSVLQANDKILTMDLAHGGHLTHGHKMNFSGRMYEVMHYGVSQETETIDYDDLAQKAAAFQPRMITVGASAYSRIIDFERMAHIAKSVDAYLFADIAHIAGLVAAGVHPTPVEHADFVTTTTHKTLRGPRGGMILCKEKYAKGVDSLVFPGCQGGPLMHVIAAKAVCYGEALKPEFKSYQEQVVRNAKALSEGMKKNGYRIVSGTTENHVMLIDLQEKDITGKEAQEALDLAGITVNKNAIPFDTQSPFKAGGIRLGTPAVTTRGMKEDQMFDIANWIHDAIQKRTNDTALAAIRQQVIELTSSYALPY
ncbi:MAG: serine hydroxymethyltransferase [Verrucomicrobiota bacterium]